MEDRRPGRPKAEAFLPGPLGLGILGALAGGLIGMGIDMSPDNVPTPGDSHEIEFCATLKNDPSIIHTDLGFHT
jgi:hypothetical protein